MTEGREEDEEKRRLDDGVSGGGRRGRKEPELESRMGVVHGVDGGEGRGGGASRKINEGEQLG